MRHPVTDDALSYVKGYYDSELLSSHSAAKPVTVLVKKAPLMGYGACSTSGCPCRGFQQTYGSELCSNCGRQYTMHW